MLPRMRAAQKAVWRDTLVVACATAIMAILCVQFNFSEALRRWTAPWERFQLDELPAVLVVLAAGLAWLAARRYAEAGRELRRREIAELQLEAVLADNRRLSQQYVLLQEAERKRLARELHDELGQYLNVIKLDAVAVREGLAHGSSGLAHGSSGHAAGLHERAEAIIANCNHIHGALTSLIRQLRPVGLDELGLAAALEHCVDTWRPRLPEVRLDLNLVGELDDLTEAVTLTVYRVLQEGLNNVAKHARAQRVVLEVGRTGELIRVTITDNGVGMDTKAPTQGLGLIGVRERVAALAGQLEVTSDPGKGLELRVCIPVDVREREV